VASKTSPRAVVTGGAGFIGSHVVDRLVELGYRVLVIDNLASGSRSDVPSAALLEERDVADPRVEPLLAKWQGELLVHCAAQVSVASSVRDPGLDAHSNIVGTVRTLQAAAAGGCRRFVYLTTGGALYGEPRYLPCDEAHQIVPLSPYGLSKWTGERYLSLLAPDSMPRMVLRLANVYGPRQRSDGEGGVVSIFAKRMKSGLPVEIHGDGQQTRDFVYVGDVVDAVVAAMNATSSITVNIGTERAVSVLELYGALSAIAGYSKSPVFIAPRPGDVRHSRLAIGKARRELDWSPHTTLEAGLAETYASMAPSVPESQALGRRQAPTE
jgi:UDP-glucose 4-epimerase